jgi:hypothetical protein
MARFTSGWTPSHRSATSDSNDNPYRGHPVLLALRVTLLNWAVRADTTMHTEWGEVRQVLRGDVVTSYEQLGEQLDVSIKGARLLIKKLQKLGFLGSNKGSRGLHLSILEYSDICNEEKNKGSKLGSSGAAEGQQVGQRIGQGNKKTKKQGPPAAGFGKSMRQAAEEREQEIKK